MKRDLMAGAAGLILSACALASAATALPLGVGAVSDFVRCEVGGLDKRIEGLHVGVRDAKFILEFF